MNNLVFFMLLMLCMAFHCMPVSWHEVMGGMLVLPFACHIYSCRGWWKMLGIGCGSRSLVEKSSFGEQAYRIGASL